MEDATLAQAYKIRSGRGCALCPGISDFHLFRYRKRIVHLDAEIPDCAFNLGMAEQELHGSQIAGAPVNQCRFRPT